MYMRAYLAMFKLRIVALLLFVALVSAAIASGGELQAERIALLFSAGALASMGASVLNHYLDRDIDALSPRTRTRPLPSGRVKPSRACWLGVALVLLALLLSTLLNYLTTLYILAGALVYVLVYTLWLKRRSALNIVVGGLAGSCAVLAGYAAMRGDTTLLALLLALLVFLWTPPHFWAFAIARREDYLRAGVPMLPVRYGCERAAKLMIMHTLLLVQASLLLYALGYSGSLYLAAAAPMGLLLLGFNMKVLTTGSRAWAWRAYRLSGIYLVVLFAALLADSALRVLP